MDTKSMLEDLMGQLGSFGRYQITQHFLHCLAWFLSGIHMMSFVFVFPVMEHRCYVEEYDGKIADLDLLNNATILPRNLTGFKDLRMHIPKNNDSGKLESCLKFDFVGNFSKDGLEVINCDSGYVYNSSYFHSSRISDWDMVCDKQWMRALLQSAFLFGTFTGAFFSGILADKFGRKPIFCLSCFVQLICGVAGAFLDNFVLFAISMFWYGLFGSAGAIVPSVALTMEIVGPSKRVLCGTMFTVMFGLGAVVVAGWAYFLPFLEAKDLQLIYALHSVLLFGHFWLMDESICWLWSNGKYKKALEIAEKAAKSNGITFEDRYSYSIGMKVSEKTEMVPVVVENTKPEVENTEKIEKVKEVEKNSEAEEESFKKVKTLDLFRYPKLRQRTLVIVYCWFACSLTYFGLSFNSVSLFGNPFMMFIISILAEIPAHVMGIWLVPKFGTKPVFAISQLITGLGCVIAAELSPGIATTVVSMIAKLTATLAFNVINSYTAELMPTTHRNTAIGICVMAARGGATLIPEINLLSATSTEIPSITFGTSGILGGLFTLFMLPETLNKPIPQRIEDVENLPNAKDEEGESK